MKSKSSLLLLAAACLFALLPHALADSAVTFEILGNFAYPDGIFTQPYALNEDGDVGGYFDDQFGISRGFVRYSDGRFSTPIVAPDGGPDYTVVRGITDSGLFCGFSEGSDIDFHGFVWSGDAFSDFDVPSAVDTFVQGMNDAGDLCGYTQNPSAGFVSIAGTVTSFTVPRALGTYPNAINNRDQCVGSYNTSTQNHGFLRDADGTLVYPVDAPRADFTFLNGIDDQGAMVGEADSRTGVHGVFFQSVKNAALFDYPGASVTVFTGINNRGLICGYYQTATNMRSRAFLVRVRPATGN